MACLAGIVDEPQAKQKRGGMGGAGGKQQPQANIDDEVEVDADFDNDDDNNDDDFMVSQEEKETGDQFWPLDELFNILDIHKTGQLDLAVFKHGLHALKVNLSDTDMDNVFRQIVEDNKNDVITYKAFLRYLQFSDFRGGQSEQYAQDILAALPRVAANRRQYVTRAAMVIKYAVRYNNTKAEINNYLLNKGLQRAEIDAAWKQFRFNPNAIRDIDFKSLIGKKGKLIDMAIRDPEAVNPFDDYVLYKLLKRAGFKAFGSKEFNDLDYLRAAGEGARISSIKCWFDPNSHFFDGLQVIYQCTNGEYLKGGRNMVAQGKYVEDEIQFQKNEVLLSVTVYFAHYVCGMAFETNERTRLFGSDLGQSAVSLIAPMGTQIMAFYGSMGRLLETVGVYVVVSKRQHGNLKGGNKQSGVHKLEHGKKKLMKNKSTVSVNGGDEGDGDYTGNYTAPTKSSKKKKKHKKRYEENDYDDEDDGAYEESY